VQSKKLLRKEDTEILRTDRIPQEKGLLKRIQEPEYRPEKINSLVQAVQDCVTNNCSSAR
jgi:hypothetical protein